MILLLLIAFLLYPLPAHADMIDWLNGYTLANTLNNNCDDCDDCRKSNELLRKKVIELEDERNNLTKNR